jgi:NADPH-dependent 2,4-dienoyl-CoA reductase/sulfur reductase-like enzyme/rhodanese-related sulfurtransferase
MAGTMKVIIIGAVAAGTAAAVKIRRQSEDAEIVIYEKDRYISYGTCGLPYFVSGEIESIEDLIENTTERFIKRFNIRVNVFHEVTGIDPGENLISVKDLKTGRQFDDRYDRLIITTGSVPTRLKFDGKQIENIFTLKIIEDAVDLKDYLGRLDKENKPGKSALLIGAGFIGLELLDTFLNRGYEINIVEKTSQILPMFDNEIIEYLEKYLMEKGIKLHKEDEISGLAEVRDGRALSVRTLKGKIIKSDIIFLAVGTKPDVKLARDSGIKIGKSGFIAVDEYMKTNFKNIYAAGDCCECENRISGVKRSYNLAAIAGRQGRIAGINAAGGREKFSGSIVNSIVKVLDLAAAKVGLSFKEAAAIDKDVDFVELHRSSHAEYYPGAEMIHMIIIFNKSSGKILGFQAIGRSGVDKRTDVVSTAISGDLKIWELADLDLGYHPAYGSARDPVNILGMIAGNLKKGEVVTLNVEKLKEKIKNKENITILDVRTGEEYERGHIDGAVNIHIDDLRKNLNKLDAGSEIIVYCRSGYRAYQAFRILKNMGFKNIKILNGSYLSWLRKI